MLHGQLDGHGAPCCPPSPLPLLTHRRWLELSRADWARTSGRLHAAHRAALLRSPPARCLHALPRSPVEPCAAPSLIRSHAARRAAAPCLGRSETRSTATRQLRCQCARGARERPLRRSCSLSLRQSRALPASVRCCGSATQSRGSKRSSSARAAHLAALQRLPATLSACSLWLHARRRTSAARAARLHCSSVHRPLQLPMPSLRPSCGSGRRGARL
jgi:hypothetical protein